MDYHKRSLAETAMFRYKQLLNPKLTFHNYNAKISGALANMKAMNKVIRLSMPIRQQIN